ncbi:hypothetical protein RUM44_002436 [Polyplax serrata]|uniref:Uncharacterized protein n=1 Tax=Polyplax serrata TaxID=468196 RepID=A0ABR1AET1_POLSC
MKQNSIIKLNGKEEEAEEEEEEEDDDDDDDDSFLPVVGFPKLKQNIIKQVMEEKKGGQLQKPCETESLVKLREAEAMERIIQEKRMRPRRQTQVKKKTSSVDITRDPMGKGLNPALRGKSRVKAYLREPKIRDIREKQKKYPMKPFETALSPLVLWYFPVRGIRKILGGRKKFGASTSTIESVDKGTGITRQTLPPKG